MERRYIKIYTPESSVTKPGKLLTEIFDGFLEGRFLAWRLYVRNINAQYRQSLLGFVWAFLPPLASGLVWIFLKDQKVFNVGDTAIPYPAFVLTGTILWQVFLDSINTPMNTIMGSKAMFTKINFPHEAILLTSFYHVISNFLIKLVLLAGVFLWFGLVPSVSIIFFFFGVFVLILFGTALSLVLTPIAMLYGDVKRAITMALQFLFFLTPIIYPTPREGVAGFIAEINPVAHVLTATRDWLTVGYTENLDAFFVVTVLSVVLFIIGVFLFKVALPHLVERIGS